MQSHPVRSYQMWLRGILLTSRPPLLQKEGIRVLPCYDHSFTPSHAPRTEQHKKLAIPFPAGNARFMRPNEFQSGGPACINNFLDRGLLQTRIANNAPLPHMFAADFELWFDEDQAFAFRLQNS